MASQALTLTTNLSSMAANRSVQGAQAQVAKSVEKLSSGIQIRQARDNPSGLAISSVFQKQIQTGTMAHRNVNDAISLVQTADSALREAADMLTRIKSLAVQGANDSLSKDQYFSLAQEMRELMHELAN